MFSDTFKVINNIRNELCDIAAQGAHYKNWSDEFARKEIREVIFNEAAPLRKKTDTIILDAHLQDMHGLELHEAGFREWPTAYRTAAEAEAFIQKMAEIDAGNETLNNETRYYTHKGEHIVDSYM